MIPYKHIAALLVGTVPFLIATIASAKDYKTYPGQQCFTPYNQVFGMTAPEPRRYTQYLEWTDYGGYTFSYICPVIRDEWGGANGPDAAFRVYAPANTIGELCCGIASVSLNADSSYSKKACMPKPWSGGWTDLFVADVTSYVEDGRYEAFCDIYKNPGARLSSYWVGEEEQYD